MMKLLAVAVALLASASISFGQAAGGGVPGAASGGGTVTGVTGTTPVVSSGGNAPAISCPTCGVTGSDLSQFALGGTIAPKVENGVSKCERYTGATADVKMNACITDAETRANGNTSGVADARGLGGAQTFSAFVSCGDSSSDPVTVLMPDTGTWTVSTQGSSSHYDFNYYTGCTMLGTSAQPTGLVIDHTAANGNSLAVMGPGPGITGAGYVNIGGFSLQANSTTLITNAVLIISGADNTIFHDMNINHYSGGEEGISTNGPNATGICCQATLKNITVNGQYSGGANLDLVASNSLVLQGLSLVNVSLDHPATPAPNFKCTSTSSGNSSVEFHGLYEETNHTLNATTMNTISACTGVMIDGFYPNDVAGSGTTTMISTTNAVNTNLVVTAMQPTNFNYGGIFVANGFTGVNTLFSASSGWSYFQQPFIGNAQAGYVIASGSIADATPVLGAILEASGGNCYGVRFGASASVVTSDMKECLFSGLLGFYNSSTRLMTLNQSTGELAGISSAAIDGFGSINVPVIQGQAYQQNSANNTAGKCTMAAATNCTITLSHTYTTPVCIVTQQSATLTGGAAGCTVSGTTVTITAATLNSEVWGAWVFGDPN